MRRFAITSMFILVCFCSLPCYALPPGAIAILGKGIIAQIDKSAVISPDGSKIAVATSVGIWLHNANTMEEIALLQHDDMRYVECLAFSPDGNILAGGGSWWSGLSLWDVPNRRFLGNICPGESVNSVAFSPNGNLIATGTAHQTAKLWNASNYQLVGTLPAAPNSQVFSVAFSPNSQLLATGSGEKTVRIWEVATRTLKKTFNFNGWMYAVAFSPDGNLLAGGGIFETALFDVPNLRELKRQSWSSYSLAFNADSTILLSACGQVVCFLNTTDLTGVGGIHGHSGQVFSISFNSARNRLVTASGDRTVKMWNFPSCQLVGTLSGYTNPVTSIAFKPDDHLLAGAGGSGVIDLWDTSSFQLLNTIYSQSRYGINSIAFSPDGNLLACGDDDGNIEFWDASTFQSAGTIDTGSWEVYSVAFSPDGKMLASGDNDEEVKLWDASTHQLIDTLTGSPDDIYSVAFSSDGKLLAGGTYKEIKIWDLDTRQIVGTLAGHISDVECVAFRPNSNLLASGSHENEVNLWNVTTQQLVHEFTGHTSWINSVAFSPDGSRLVSGADDNKVNLWDVSGLYLLRTFFGHRDDVNSVAFSPDGELLASGGDDGLIILWDSGAPPQNIIHLDNGWNLMSFSAGRCFYHGDLPASQDGVAMINVDTIGYSSLADWFTSVIEPRNTWQMVIGVEGAMDRTLPSIFHTLKSMSCVSGYWVKINNPSGATLTIEGTPFDTSRIISLPAGWNLVGCPIRKGYYDSDTPPSGANAPEGTIWEKVSSPVAAQLFDSIRGKYDLILGQEGAYDPNLPAAFSSLHFVSSGYGLWIKMKVSGNLIYSMGETGF